MQSTVRSLLVQLTHPLTYLPRHPVLTAWCAGIDFKLNSTVSKVDIKGKSVDTTSGDKYTFEKLIIATGCVARSSSAVLRCQRSAVRLWQCSLQPVLLCR